MYQNWYITFWNSLQENSYTDLLSNTGMFQFLAFWNTEHGENAKVSQNMRNEKYTLIVSDKSQKSS